MIYKEKLKIIFPPVLLILSTVFLYIPSLVYFSNRLSFDNYFINLIANELFIAVILGITISITLLFFKHSYLKFVTSLLSIFGILLWLQGDFFVISYGVMDGSVYDFSGFTWRYWYEILILILLFVFSIKYNKIINKHFPFIIIMIVVGQVFTVSYKLITEPKDKIIVETIDQEFFNYSSNKNIIVIILDTFGGDYFQSILQSSPSLANNYPGFVNYTNAVSNYPATKGSLPSLLTGEMLPNDILFDDFVNTKVVNKGLPKVFEKKGYLVSMISTQEEFENFYSNRFIARPLLDFNILNKYNGYKILDYSLFRAMPLFIKPLIYNNGYWILSNKLAKFIKLPRFNSEKGFYMMNLMAEKVKVKDNRKRFKIIHVLLPHPKLVYDNNCQRTPTKEKTVAKMLDQSKCAIKTLNKLLEKYKKLGIYDNSLIVVMSDHGARIFANKAQTGFPSYFEMESSHALLMIKGVNQKEAFRNIDTPVSLIKLYDMVVEESSHDKQIDFLFDNEIKFYSYRYENVIENGFLPDGAIYSIGKDSFNPNSWNLEKLVTHQCPTIKLPTKVKILKKRNKNYCAKFGFSKPERDGSGSWTESKDVRILLKLDFSQKNLKEYLSFDFNYTPFLKATQTQLELNFYINGVLIHSQNVTRLNKNITSFKVPMKLLKDKKITELKILIPHLLSGKDMGLSSDTRKLGVLLHSINIK